MQRALRDDTKDINVLKNYKATSSDKNFKFFILENGQTVDLS